MLAGFCISPAGAKQTANSAEDRLQTLPTEWILPLPTQDGVTFAQITEKRPIDLTRSGGSIAFIWGGKSGKGWLGSRYYPMDRDLNRDHDITWFQSNLADAVAYRCDGKTPATTYTYRWGSYMPVDVTNPRVRDYLFKTYMMPALAGGEKVIALDNVSLRNLGGRCGAYREGHWSPFFSGKTIDPDYATSVLDWVAWLRDRLHREGGRLALNAKIDGDDARSVRQLVASADIWLLEAGFTRNCKERVSDDRWHSRMDLARWAAARIPWVDLDKSCAPPDLLDDDEAQWIVANFLLAKGSQSVLGVIHDGDPSRQLRYPATLNPPVGHPVAEAVQINTAAMMRMYSKGLVVVNASSKAVLRFKLPQGVWTDIHGKPISRTLILSPTAAAVLLH